MTKEIFKNINPYDIAIIKHVQTGDEVSYFVLNNEIADYYFYAIREDFKCVKVTYRENGTYELIKLYRDNDLESFVQEIKEKLFKPKGNLIYEKPSISKVMRDDLKEVLWMMAKRGYRSFQVTSHMVCFYGGSLEDYYTNFLHEIFIDIFDSEKDYEIADVLANWRMVTSA